MVLTSPTTLTPAMLYSSSGLPVTLGSLTSSVCTVAGRVVTPVATGPCTLVGRQAGSARYLPASAARSLRASVPVPSITRVSPSTGLTTGERPRVTVTGAGFAAGAIVRFGSAAATAVTLLSATSINVTAPPHARGAVTVSVTNTNGKSASKPNAFTYLTSKYP